VPEWAADDEGMNTGYRVGAAALVMMAALAASGCGASQQEIDAARQAGAVDASRAAAEEKAKADKAKLEKDVADLKAQQEKLQAQASAKATATATPTQRSGGGSGGGGSSCGSGVSVNSVTTCTFAHTVVADWRASGGGNASFWSYSPVTGRNYWMSCTAGTTTVCRGGNGAVVYIR